MLGLQTVPVGPFSVANSDRLRLVQAAVRASAGKRVIYALHVGGLNDRRNARFVDAMNKADLVYADGMAVVLLARSAGARGIERAATTDIGGSLLAAEGQRLGRTSRVAIIGGPDGLAASAGNALESHGLATVVYATHGFHSDYASVLENVAAANPDVVIVGMGMPREALWVEEHRGDLPDGLILTCGGWLGFLAGTEARAPAFMQKLGLEWLYRVYQSPTRLWARYALGLATTARLLPRQISYRMARR